jgi:histidinol phosphatase-like PHP family hydrolase
MIDFHTHTFLSDGALGPSELVRRAQVAGYRAIGLTDHVDGSNLSWVVPRILKAAGDLNRFLEIIVIPGVEITHAPPGQIGELVREARELGAALVIVHGESPVEPVAPGTNEAAVEAGADILAHPGLISQTLARRAAEKGVSLEITARAGHGLTNGHVAKTALGEGAALVFNTDTHAPGDLASKERAWLTLRGAGLSEAQTRQVLNMNETLLERLVHGPRPLKGE